MTQRINLFLRLPQPEEEKYVVSNGLLKTLGSLALAGFVGLFLVQGIKLGVEGRSVKVLTAQQAIVQANLTSLEAKYPEATKLLLEEQGQQKEKEIEAKGKFLEIMKTQLADVPGFTEPLEALAKQISVGVWLTQIEIDHEEGLYRFQGHAFQVEQVLGFIENLGKDEFFSTKNFKVFEVLQERSEEGFITFILATE